jgi:hypothetical protein
LDRNIRIEVNGPLRHHSTTPKKKWRLLPDLKVCATSMQQLKLGVCLYSVQCTLHSHHQDWNSDKSLQAVNRGQWNQWPGRQCRTNQSTRPANQFGNI